MRGLARLARKTFPFSLILAVKSRFLPLLWWHPVYTSWQLWATRHPIVGSMAFYELLKMLWEPGFLSYAPGSESAHMFHLSHFHRLVRFCWFGLVVGAVCLFCFCFLVVFWPTCSIELSTDDHFSISSWLPLSLRRAQHSPKKKCSHEAFWTLWKRVADSQWDWGASVFGLVIFWPVLIDTIIHPCFKRAVSHVARVCAFGHWQQNAIDHVCVSGEFDHSFCRWFWLWTWLGRIVKFVGIWILNPLKPVAGSQWHWGLRCLASIFGIRLIIFVFGDFCVFNERFCGNASHPVVAFVSVVAFCGLF